MNWEMVDKSLTDLVQRYHIPGGALVIHHKGQPVYSRCFGYSDYENTRPATLDDVYWLYSLTKLSTVTAVMQLVEAGLIKLSDPVMAYLPAFRNLRVVDGGALRPARSLLTVAHLLTMRGGFSYDLKNLKIVLRPGDGQMKVINTIAKEPLTADPGARFQYSLCHDVLGGIIEKVTELSPQEYFQKNIYSPLGMTKTRFVASADKRRPFMAQYVFNEAHQRIEKAAMTNEYVLTPQYASCGAGLTSTPGDYIWLINALANGKTILRGETISLMAQNRLLGSDLNAFKAWRPGYGYGLGIRSRLGQEGTPEFGWDGAGGAYALCDPKEKLAVLYMQQVLNLPYAYDVVHPSLRDGILKGIAL